MCSGASDTKKHFHRLYIFLLIYLLILSIFFSFKILNRIGKGAYFLHFILSSAPLGLIQGGELQKSPNPPKRQTNHRDHLSGFSRSLYIPMCPTRRCLPPPKSAPPVQAQVLQGARHPGFWNVHMSFTIHAWSHSELWKTCIMAATSMSVATSTVEINIVEAIVGVGPTRFFQ